MQNRERDLVSRTKSFARRIIRLYIALPKQTLPQVLGKQLLRSGTSVGANYREANRARSKAEFPRGLELLSDEEVIRKDRLEPLLKETNELISILVTISKRARGD